MPIASVSLAIAVLSLSTAMYQGWLQTRNLEVIQRDLARRELVRSCKDVIEAYFEAKLRIDLLARGSGLAPADRESGPDVQAAVAVSRFAAIGTYLANFQGEAARERYTALSAALAAAMEQARRAGAATTGLFEAADGLFHGMNEDCVRSARQAP